MTKPSWVRARIRLGKEAWRALPTASTTRRPTMAR